MTLRSIGAITPYSWSNSALTVGTTGSALKYSPGGLLIPPELVYAQANSDGSVTVYWYSSAYDFAYGISGYQVFRSVSPIGPRVAVSGVLPASSLMTQEEFSYTDHPSYHMPYYYWVYAYGAEKWLWYSVTSSFYDSVTPVDLPEPPVPDAPILTVSDWGNDQGGTILVQWVQPPYAFSQYFIGRSTTSGGPYDSIGVVSGVTYFFDYSCQDKKTYYYVVQYFDGTRPSVYSNEGSVASLDNLAPPQVTGVSCVYLPDIQSIRCDWTPSSEPNMGGYFMCPTTDEESREFARSGCIPGYRHVNTPSPFERPHILWGFSQPPASDAQGVAFYAMDRSGNAGAWSDLYWIPTKILANTKSTEGTAFNNAVRLIRDSAGNIHYAYTSGSVYYGFIPATTDVATAVKTTTNAPIGIGNSPALGLDSQGQPCVVWKDDTRYPEYLSALYFARETASGWTSPVKIAVFGEGCPTDVEGGFSPPAVIVRADTSYVAYVFGYRIPWGPAEPPNPIHFYIYLKKFPIGNPSVAQTETVDIWTAYPYEPYPYRSPTLCFDGKGYLHIAWEKAVEEIAYREPAEIYHRVRKPTGWTTAENISQSPDIDSREPSLSCYGDVHICWQEGDEVYHRYGNWGLAPTRVIPPIELWWWSGAENVSNSPGIPSLQPFFSGNYLSWSENERILHSSYSYEVWTTPDTLFRPVTAPDDYPELAFYQGSTASYLYAMCTNFDPRAELGGIRYKIKSVPATALYSAQLGGTTPSPLTASRDTFLLYTASTISVDAGKDSLVYGPFFVEKDKKQRLDLEFFQMNPEEKSWKYKVYVDEVPMGEVWVPNHELVNFSKWVPDAVTHDGEFLLKIVRKVGDWVTLKSFALFEFTPGQSGGGGSQTAGINYQPSTINYQLYQNYPNPFREATEIRYQIAGDYTPPAPSGEGIMRIADCGKRSAVSLKVYNVAGQLVRTLVNESKSPGAYKVTWDGKAESGKRVADGVYFYRLQAGEFSSTKKLILIR